MAAKGCWAAWWCPGTAGCSPWRWPRSWLLVEQHCPGKQDRTEWQEQGGLILWASKEEFSTGLTTLDVCPLWTALSHSAQAFSSGGLRQFAWSVLGTQPLIICVLNPACWAGVAFPGHLQESRPRQNLSAAPSLHCHTVLHPNRFLSPCPLAVIKSPHFVPGCCPGWLEAELWWHLQTAKGS